MTIAQSMLPEFDHEMQNTRKTLERVSDEKWSWKPQEKAGTIGWYAKHLASLPKWGAVAIKTEQLDVAPTNGPAYQWPSVDNREQALQEFDKNVKETREAMTGVSDADLMKSWSLLRGGQTMISMPRIACLRGFMMNHIIHHRGQLTTYYRILGIPVPALYGPSGDEGQFGPPEAAAKKAN